MTPARRVVLAAMTEAEWQAQVIDTAQLHGWRHLHVRRAIGYRDGRRAYQTPTNVSGWPDLFLWNPRQGRTLAAELKRVGQKPTPAQRRILDELAAAGVETHVWTPLDEDEVAVVLAPPRLRNAQRVMMEP